MRLRSGSRSRAASVPPLVGAAETDELPRRRTRGEALPSSVGVVQDDDGERGDADDSGSVVISMSPRSAATDASGFVLLPSGEDDDSRSVPLPPAAVAAGSEAPTSRRAVRQQPILRDSESRSRGFDTLRELGPGGAISAAAAASPGERDGYTLGASILALGGVEAYAICYGVTHAVLCGAKRADAAIRATSWLADIVAAALRTVEAERAADAAGEATPRAEKKRSELMELRTDELGEGEANPDGSVAGVSDAATLARRWRVFLAETESLGAAARANVRSADNTDSGGRRRDDGEAEPDEESDATNASVFAALNFAAKHGFPHDMQRDDRAFFKGLQRAAKHGFGYSYRIRPGAAAAVAAATGAAAAGPTEGTPAMQPPSSNDKVGRVVVVPQPHHRHPELINTRLQCVEPRQRKRVLEDHTVLAHPRKGSAAGVEDFAILDQVTRDALFTILRHVQRHRTLQGLPHTVAGVMLNHVFDGDPDAYNAARTATPSTASAAIDTVVAKTQRLLMAHAATAPALLNSVQEIATMCHVALWREEGARVVGAAVALLRAPDGPLSSLYGLREVGTHGVALPNYFAAASGDSPFDAVASLSAVLDAATMAALKSTLLPLLQAAAAPQGGGPQPLALSELAQHCDAARRDELTRLVRNVRFEALPALMRIAPPALAEARSDGNTVSAAAFPVTLQMLLVLEAMTLLLDHLSQLALLDGGISGAGTSGDGVPSALRRMMKALPNEGWGSCEAVLDWALGDASCGANVVGARLAAVPVLCECVAQRVANMMRDSATRRALGLIIAFETYAHQCAAAKRSSSSWLLTCGERLRTAFRAHLLFTAMHQKLTEVHGFEAVATGNVPIPDVFVVECEIVGRARGGLLSFPAVTIRTARRVADDFLPPL